MATLASALAFARSQAQTDSNGLTDANGIIFANEALLDLHRQMIEHGVDASQVQESFCDGALPTTLGNGSTFLYPIDMFFLKAIEVNYTDTSPVNYKTATQVDVSNLPAGQSFSYLRAQGDPNAPQFDDHGDWYELFPAFTASSNLSQAIRVFYFLAPTEYTATSDTLSYPEKLDYRILGWKIASSYLYSLQKMDEGQAFEAQYQKKLTSIIGTLARGSEQPIEASGLTLTGFEF